MKLAFLAILVVISVVVYQQDQASRPVVQPDLEVLIQEWQDEMTANGVRWEPRWNRINSVVVKELGDNSLRGEWTTAGQILVIDSSLFYLPNAKAEVRFTLWHELGHAYGLGHNGDGRLMSEYALGPLELHESWPAMKSEYIKILKREGYE